MQAYKVLTESAAIARIRPPRLVLRLRRSACYHPFGHVISLSTTLLSQLECRDLDALIAHEVGHARRRRVLILKAIASVAPPIVLCLAGATVAAVVHALTARAWCAVATFAAAVCVTAWVAQRLVDRWEVACFAEEVEADRFAAEVTGRHDAMVHVLKECARIEDGGVLSVEATRRIMLIHSVPAAGARGRPNAARAR